MKRLQDGVQVPAFRGIIHFGRSLDLYKQLPKGRVVFILYHEHWENHSKRYFDQFSDRIGLTIDK